MRRPAPRRRGLLIAVPLGVGLGTFVALRRNSLWDTAVVLLLVAGTSIPNFAMAAFLVYLLSIRLGWLPVAGWGTISQAVLPVLLLAVPPARDIARLSRSTCWRCCSRITSGRRARRAARRLVVYRHALRNTLVPLLTMIGIILGGLLSGTFVIETLFNIARLGRLAIQSIFARDYPVTMAIVLLFTFFYAGLNLVVDLLYGVARSRIRLTADRGGRA